MLKSFDYCYNWSWLLSLLTLLNICWHFRKLRTSIHDNPRDLTIKSDTGQHSQFLRCLNHYCALLGIRFNLSPLWCNLKISSAWKRCQVGQPRDWCLAQDDCVTQVGPSRPNWCDLVWKVPWPGKLSIDHWVSQLYFQCSVPLQIGIKFFHIKILWIKFLRHAEMRQLDKTLIRLSVRAIKWSVHTFDASPSTLTSGHLESNHALESFSFTNSSTAS